MILWIYVSKQLNNILNIDFVQQIILKLASKLYKNWGKKIDFQISKKCRSIHVLDYRQQLLHSQRIFFLKCYANNVITSHTCRLLRYCFYYIYRLLRYWLLQCCHLIASTVKVKKQRSGIHQLVLWNALEAFDFIALDLIFNLIVYYKYCRLCHRITVELGCKCYITTAKLCNSYNKKAQ